ncbi:MAG: polymer-forming cytoskeletal protein [Cytophagales bacterium]|nr:polymer-forming cytoskeletal protein [Cytophagales bacterium]
MFGQNKQPPIKSLIAGGTVITGNLAFADGLRVDGHIQGDITATKGTASLLVISETAIVTGDIHADHVIINGAVQGNVCADQLLELQPKAKIDGDIIYKALEMHQGAVISGRLSPLTGKVEEAAILQLRTNDA